MYVCLCKGLTESDVVSRTRDCIDKGITCPAAVIEALGLHGDEACGYCAEHPAHFVAILEDELEMYDGAVKTQEPASRA